MPPKILVFGPPRSGTQSLSNALESIGYDPMYHMREVAVNQHPGIWTELLDQKYDTANHPEGVDHTKLEQILQNFEGLSDFPASIFVEELLALYPTAHVILTRRDEDSWVASMNNTLIKTFNKDDTVQDRSSPMQPMRERYHSYCWKNDFETHGRAYLQDYVRNVRKVVAEAKRPLLEFDARQGWEPLCEFLGVNVPDRPYPHDGSSKGKGW